MARWGLVLGTLLLLEILARAELIDPLIMPPPSAMVSRLTEIVGTDQFVEDLTTTGAAILVAFGIGAVLGLSVGVLFWRLPFVGATFEPYLVSLYSMPTLVFYPIFLAIFGLGPAPIIIIATTMAVIPIALNTMAGLNAVSPTLFKLAESLNCNRAQTYLKVLAPAATPLLIPGLVLGFIYAVIGVIAMEFILASEGLGFQIGYLYRSFEIVDMYAYIVVVIIIAVIANVLLNTIERRVRQDME